MMKNKKVLIVLGCLNLGVGAATIGLGSMITSHVVETAATTMGTVDLEKGVFTAAAEPEKAYITWEETYWMVKQHQGASTTVVNGLYTAAPRLYKGHYLSFEAPDGVTFDSIVITYSGSYAGSDLTCDASTTSNGAVPASEKPAGAITLTKDTNALTWTTANLGNAKSVYIQNSYNSASSYTQLRPTQIAINYVVVVNPTVCTVTLTSSSLTELGQTTQATAALMPENTTDKSVTWTSSDENVAIVDAAGLITATGVGDSTITATSNAVATVTGSATLNVTATASTVYDKTQSPTHYAVNNGDYPTSGYYANLDNVLYYSEKIGVMGGVIQGQSGTGLLYNKSAFASTIKDVIITLDTAGTAPCTVAFGATANAKTIIVTPTVSGAVNTYTPSESYSYFTIYSPTTTLKIASIVIELVDTNVEAARTWATNFLSATNVCDSTGAADNITSAIWTAQNDAFMALASSAKTALTSEACYATATGIQQVLARYKYIVNKYGAAIHTNFLGIAVAPSAQVSVSKTTETWDAVKYVLGAIVLFAAGAFFVFRKKKQA